VRTSVVSSVGWQQRLIQAGGVLAALVVLASCGSSVATVTAPGQTRCDIDASAQNASFPASGGTGTIRISTNRECGWSVQSDAAWLTLAAPLSGQGTGSLQYSVAANPDPPPRTAVIRVDDRQLPISQEGTPCGYRLSSTQESVDQSGGERTIQVTTASTQCRWTAAADVGWITIASGQSGSGSGAVSFTVDATSGPERTGTVTIAGVAVAVMQSRGCRYSVDSPPPLPAAGGAAAFAVRTGDGCAWTASSGADWLALSPASGNGPGEIRVSVGTWPGPQRSATVRIADQTATVSQASGCTVSFSPAALNVEPSASQSDVQVNTVTGCVWSASSGAPWITVAGASGSGGGQVQVAVAANSGPARQGTVAIAGKALAVSQGSGCTYAATPTTHVLNGAAGKGTVLVSTNSACRWGAASQVPWITVQESSIVGTGVLTFNVAANPGPVRTATFTVAGHTIMVTQGPQ
jgi:hypothetical protein